MPIWLQVVLAGLVPASALGGVWLGARLSTDQAATQWRRDRLLQFCSDLIAACHEVISRAGRIHDAMPEIDAAHDPQYPHDEVQRMQHAVGTVRLLSEGLEPFAFELEKSVMSLLGKATKDEGAFMVAYGTAGEAEGKFQKAAYEELRGHEPQWWVRMRAGFRRTDRATPLISL